jgi:hypothetical protein
LDTPARVDVPVQYFQSVIAIELAVAGALLWQIRYFESGDAKRRDGDDLPDPRLRLGLALVLGLTLFGSLWAIAVEGPKWAAVAVTVGLAVSLVPILLRVLPPLAKDEASRPGLRLNRGRLDSLRRRRHRLSPRARHRVAASADAHA